MDELMQVLAVLIGAGVGFGLVFNPWVYPRVVRYFRRLMDAADE